jgi:hypothetical protein
LANCEIGGLGRIRGDRLASESNAGRISERQIALVAERLGWLDFQFAGTGFAMEMQRVRFEVVMSFARHEVSVPLKFGRRHWPDLLGVRKGRYRTPRASIETPGVRISSEKPASEVDGVVSIAPQPPRPKARIRICVSIHCLLQPNPRAHVGSAINALRTISPAMMLRYFGDELCRQRQLLASEAWFRRLRARYPNLTPRRRHQIFEASRSRPCVRQNGRLARRVSSTAFRS